MAAAPKPMVSVAVARARAAKHFDAHYREWVAQILVERLSLSEKHFVGDGCCQEPRLAIGLHPPTERQAISFGKDASEWVATWRSSPVARFVNWTHRAWSRVGSQNVPERVVLEGAEDIAAFAGRLRFWKLVDCRMGDLRSHLCVCWSSRLAACDTAEFATAVKRSAAAIAELDEDGWNTALLVFDWLAGHPEEYVYVRQLPVRGVDTKWLETHRSVIEPLFQALTGTLLPFMKPPAQMRIRILDEELAPYGLRDLSVLPAEFAFFSRKPHRVVVCENLVTMLALPDMPGTIAIHGGGYAVAALNEVAWLADARILYWGDLDADGFFILNRIRCHFPHVESVLMDEKTLEVHRDLCVPDPNPKRSATLEHLTREERSTLEVILSTSPALRLEQERMGWDYALKELAQAMGGLSDQR